RREDSVSASHPDQRGAGPNDFGEATVFALAQRNCFLGAQIVAHDFAEQLTAAALLGSETLTDDVTQTVGKTNTELLFFAKREKTKNTIDRLAGIDRVQRAEDQMSGFRRHERDFHGGAIAHFADEDDFGRFA